MIHLLTPTRSRRRRVTLLVPRQTLRLRLGLCLRVCSSGGLFLRRRGDLRVRNLAPVVMDATAVRATIVGALDHEQGVDFFEAEVGGFGVVEVEDLGWDKVSFCFAVCGWRCEVRAQRWIDAWTW